MLSPAEIQGMAERKYFAYLRSLVTKEVFFPIRIRFGIPSTTDEFATLQRDITALATGNFGYTIEWSAKNTRKYGMQNLPSEVRFDTEDQFVKALDKEREVQRFRTNVDATLNRLPQLQEWVAAHAKWVVELGQIWNGMLLVCEYFLANPRPGIYVRQLPIAVHTKFIQENYKILTSMLDFLLPKDAKTEDSAFEARFGLKPLEPLIRFRALDSEILGRLGISHPEMGLPLGIFRQLSVRGIRVLITENLMNFECLPDLPNALAIWGQGNAAELLQNLPWLADCDVYYWGDIDEHGFHILARLRGKFPGIRSVMMDLAALETFRNLAGPGEKAGRVPVNLTDSELMAYAVVEREGLRLEQEKIPQAAALLSLKKLYD